MSQRYFLTTESAYEALRLALDAALGFPKDSGTSIFTPALEAPRDSLRRIVLAVDDALPYYTEIIAQVTPLLSSASAQELTEAEYLAFLVCVTESGGGGSATFTTVTDTLTYTNFLPEGGSLATALSEIDSVLSGKAGTGDLVYVSGAGSHSVKPAGADATVGNYSVILGGDPQSAAGNSSVICGGSSNSIAGDYSSVLGGFSNSGGEYDNVHLIGSHITAAASDYTLVNNLHIVGAWNGSALAGGVLKFPDGTTMSTAGAAVSHAHGAITSDGKVGSTAGLVLKTGTAGAVEALAQGTAGQVLKVNSGATGVEWGAAAADVSIDASAADILSASSGSITADDPGADRLVFWDDSAGKLTHLTVSTGLSISGTTLTASVSASDISQGTLAYARMADPTVTSPSQITGNQNDYASFARGINRFTTNAARDITGMVAGNDGEVRVLCNTGTTAANTLTIKDESSSSTAANRFSVPWNGDCVIPAEGSVVVFYDGTSSRWRVV